MADVSQHFNSLHIAGRLTAKPTLRFTKGTPKNPDGIPFIEFRLAHNSSRKTDKQTNEHTTFLNCELWGSRAQEALKVMDTGDLVEVVGPLQINQYEKDGYKFFYTKCLVRLILHNKKVIKLNEQTANPQEDEQEDEDIDIDTQAEYVDPNPPWGGDR